MPKVQSHLYGRGGNIILVQVENEYGSFGCDFAYTYKIKDITEQYVQSDALLYTTDGSYEQMVRCGHINGTVQTIDFGGVTNAMNQFKTLRKYYPHGPLINSEFYPGWLSHWQEDFPVVPAAAVTRTLNEMLQHQVNVNFYMFFGGTNFGFTNGANSGPFLAQTTSYDYDAPLSEAGDVTAKYWAIRNVTARYTFVQDVPPNPRKLIYPEVQLTLSANLFNDAVRKDICPSFKTAANPPTFEEFNQKGGLVIYETLLPINLNDDPEILHVEGVRDRALVYVDRSYVGVLSREKLTNQTIAFSPNNGKKLQLIVEDQGRINYGTLDTWKGIRAVKVGNVNLVNWNATACPLNGETIAQVIRDYSNSHRRRFHTTRGPTFYIGAFDLTSDQVLDTFMDMRGWSKGVAYINGHNLGRYWSTVKPQKTLYVPKEFLMSGSNLIILLELQSAAVNRTVQFLDHPLLY